MQADLWSGGDQSEKVNDSLNACLKTVLVQHGASNWSCWVRKSFLLLDSLSGMASKRLGTEGGQCVDARVTDAAAWGQTGAMVTTR
ncbi:hypothetical protein [Acidithiobacillus thiooxidans]|uniref:Uncharacterized protein n=1 Tax=Acidithiobacillus thiooxidans ATCC 19377 TaxID=637390 RepID=A0A543Q3D7_ACITH|nr:hypothetical protein [Acidithiobacillus thiooxidans]TQN50808.1 hypothetical protein DLNHIDIE_00664 [Acidithiobacillus thiooxidans ATCC 19377]